MARRDSAVKQHILTTTVAMISEYGPTKIRVADVARRADVGVPTIYYHFDSRSNLLAEAQVVRYEEFLRPARELMDAMEAALVAEDRGTFDEAVDRYLSLVWAPRVIGGTYEFDVMLECSVDPVVSEEILDATRRQHQRWVAIVARAQQRRWFGPSVDGDVLTSLFWSASVGQLVVKNSVYRKLAPEALVALFRAIMDF